MFKIEKVNPLFTSIFICPKVSLAYTFRNISRVSYTSTYVMSMTAPFDRITSIDIYAAFIYIALISTNFSERREGEGSERILHAYRIVNNERKVEKRGRYIVGS